MKNEEFFHRKDAKAQRNAKLKIHSCIPAFCIPALSLKRLCTCNDLEQFLGNRLLAGFIVRDLQRPE